MSVRVPLLHEGHPGPRYTRSVGHTPLRIVSALLMSVVLTVPVLGAVCDMLCEPGTGTRAHRAHAGHGHQAASGSQTGGHQHAHAPIVDSTATHHHHGSLPATTSDTPRPSAAWSDRCCDQPTLTLAAIPVVRHEQQIDPAALEVVSLVLGDSDIRQASVRRDTSRAPTPPRPSNPILRI